MARTTLRKIACGAMSVILVAAVLPLAGCDEKKEEAADEEKVIDVEAPGVDVEVEKSKDDGSLDVDVLQPEE